MKIEGLTQEEAALLREVKQLNDNGHTIGRETMRQVQRLVVKLNKKHDVEVAELAKLTGFSSARIAGIIRRLGFMSGLL